MQKHYDLIYLSPHLDDAALSCGGQICQYTRLGQRVLVLTVMAGDPPAAAMSGYAASLHDRWQLATHAVAARRAEDLAACAILGAEAAHWEIPDCIYRGEPSYYLSDDDIFGQVHAAEQPLVEQLAERLAALPSHDRLLVPVGVGNHVDHQLVCMAATRAFDPLGLVYYEEFPYAQKELAVVNALGDLHDNWSAEVIVMPQQALDIKVKAIAAYQSQLSTFFTDLRDLYYQVKEFALDSGGGERLWHMRA
jgi:LmbE family N-acetylglucosaminyl deacetylase